MTKKTITTEEAKGKTLKAEFQHGGSRRQEILDKAAPDVSSCYLPHAVNSAVFHPAKTQEEMAAAKESRKTLLGDPSDKYYNPNKKIFFAFWKDYYFGA